MINVYHAENIRFLKFALSSKKKYNLIYIDPPFNTGKVQKIHNNEYCDIFESSEDYINFINERVKAAYDLLKDDGSFFIHADYREIHYIKIEMDKIFGRSNFINEIIWSYDYGGRSRNKWSCKHDNILFYAKNNKNYKFNFESMDRIPYMAPSLVGAEKAERGKTPTDVWWNTIVPTQGAERLGYPTQKPLGIINRIILVHSDENDNVLDFFAGSGTTGQSCLNYKRNCDLVDQNQQAIDIMKNRFANNTGVKFLKFKEATNVENQNG